MTKSLQILSILALIWAQPGLAQDSDAPAEPDAGATAATDTASETASDADDSDGDGDANIGGPLDLGQTEAAEARPQAETFIRDTFGDWSLQCLRLPEREGAEAAEDVCQMYQLLTEEGGASVAEVSIFRLANDERAVAGGTFVVPLETLLTQKLRVSVDGGPARTYDYSFCAQVGCYARVGFTAEDIQAFRAGAVAQVTIVPALAPDQRVTVEMSLSGFTAAFEEVSTLSQ